MASNVCRAPGTDAVFVSVAEVGPAGPRGSATWNAIVNRLTLIGWLLLGAEFGFIGFQLDRIRSIDPDGTRFASAWDRRIEVLGFIMLPPNIVVLAPAALIAALATIMAGHDPDPWLSTLLRVVAAAAITLGFIGIPAIIEVAMRPGSIEIDQVFIRLGGMSFAAGLATLCRLADTTAQDCGDSSR